LPAADDRPYQTFVLQRSLAIEIEDRGKGQPVLIGHQAAEIVGEFFRQHGNDPAGEIDGCSPLVGIAVDCRSGFNEMTDISDRHIQPVTGLGLDHGDGIVEILGRLPVDCHVKDIAQVFPAWFRDDFVRQCGCFPLCLLAEFVRKSEFLDHEPHLDIDVVCWTKDFEYLTPDVSVGFVALVYSDDNDFALAEIRILADINGDCKRKADIFGNDMTTGPVLDEKTRQPLGSPGQDLDDRGLRPFIAACSVDPDQYPVPLAGQSHPGCRNKGIPLECRRIDSARTMRPESETPWVLFQHGLIEGCMLAEGVFSFAALYDEFVGDQAFNGGFQVGFSCMVIA